MMRGLVVVGLAVALSGPALAAPGVDLARISAELAASEPGRRVRAARELPGLPAATARPLVRRALDDVDLDVRIAAVQAVGLLELTELAQTLLDRVSSTEPSLREATIGALAPLSPSDEHLTRAIELALLRALSDPEAQVRAAALHALLERPARTVARAGLVEGLASALGDERPELRRAAAEALERLADPAALHALAARVDDSSPEVRMAIARALGALGDARAAPAVMRLVEDGAEEVRAAAISTLGVIGAAMAVPRLTPILSRPRDTLAGLAAVALGRIAGAARADDDRTTSELRARAGGALVAAIRRDENRNAAFEGIRAAGGVGAGLLTNLLPAFGGRPSDALLLLAGDLAAAGNEAMTRELLASARIATDGRFEAALVRARPPEGPARDALVLWLAGRLGDPGAAARRGAADALGALGDARAASALAAMLGDPDPAARRAALTALARTSSAAEPRLLEAARGADAELAHAAIVALSRRHDDPARQALASALGAADQSISRAAALGLADDAGAAVIVQPALVWLKTGSHDAREAASLALLGPLRGKADPVARELCLTIAATDDAGSAGALELLGAMRDVASADRLVALVIKLGRRPQRRARLYAVLGDLLLAGDSAPAIRALTSGLDDPDASVRSQAAWALGKARAAPEAATKALSAHLADTSGAVRANALGALARLGRAPVGAALARLAQDRELAVRVNAARLGASVNASGRDAAPMLTRALREHAAPLKLGADYVLLRVADDAATGARPVAARLGLPDGLAAIVLTDERGIVRDEGVAAGELIVDVDPSLFR